MEINKLNINGVEYNLTDKDAQSKIESLQLNTYTKTEVDGLIDIIDNKVEDIDLTPYETIEGAESKYQPKGDYITEHQPLDNYYTKAEVDSAIDNVDELLKDYATKEELYDDTEIKNRVSELEAIDHTQYLTEHQDISYLATKAEVSDKVDAIEIPSKVSELENDSKYQTESEVKAAIQKVVGAAPTALDTLEEIADKLSDNDDVVAGIVNVLSTKADTSVLTNYYTLDEVDFKVADSIADKPSLTDLSNVLADEILDNQTFPEINSLTRDELKKDLFIDLWNQACGLYGMYNVETGYFELNGLTDLTYELAIMIYSSYHKSSSQSEAISHFPIRTNIPVKTQWITDLQRYAQNNITIEVLNLPFGLNSSTNVNMFYNCLKLRELFGLFSIVDNFSKNPNTFYNCIALERLEIRDLRGNIDVQWSPLLTLESLNYLVTNAANDLAITITVHPDVYAKLTDESNTEWNKVLNDAVNKNISFATI